VQFAQILYKTVLFTIHNNCLYLLNPPEKLKTLHEVVEDEAEKMDLPLIFEGLSSDSDSEDEKSKPCFNARNMTAIRLDQMTN